TFLVCPTGEGKSLCYQIPAVAKRPDLTVVVSPLKALMNDQVAKLRELGIAADTYHSDMDDRARAATLARVRSGETTIILISPERFSTEEMFGAITSRKVGLVTVDEAHCMSLWGHDFRITYMNVGNVFDRICKSQGERPPLLFLSATAPAHIRKDVRELMGLETLNEVVLPPLRSNLKLELIRLSEPPGSTRSADFHVRMAELQRIVGNSKSDRTVIYCNTVRETEMVSVALR
ncbi:MAG: DEAD/DEAH box helicase, partial [Thaumarchaeota archaeon]|nr:DEAD/DEAH box helicase [Nitrososphaerota archaeon]